MKESKVEGVEGWLLYNPFEDDYFFRVYHADKTYTDYDLLAADIKVKIIDPYVSLYTKDAEDSDELNNELDYSSKTLGKDK